MTVAAPVHSFTMRVSFGDCDPAGIVYYPHLMAWMDRTFHDWLNRFGGHAELGRKLGSTGFGLMEVGAKFRRPVRDGDLLVIDMSIEGWDSRALRLAYAGSVGGQAAFEGREVRAVFIATPQGLRAGEMAGFRALVQ